MAFLDSYGSYVPDLEPADFDVCPVLLTQPDNDKWTPLHLSTPFLDQMTKVPVTIKHLAHGGHYSVEPQALTQLHDFSLQFIQQMLQD